MLRSSFLFCVALLVSLSPSLTSAQEALPSEMLLPATTKGYVSVPDVALLREKFSQTQLGELVADPIMKPFVEDLRRQIDAKLGKSGVKIGIAWEDLEEVYGGETCFATIQPDGDKKAHALALIVNVGENQEAATKLLEKVTKNLLAKEAKKAVRKVGTVEISAFTLPKKKEETAPQQIYQAYTNGRIIASDHLGTIEGIVRRISGDRKDALGNLEAFRATYNRCQKEIAEEAPHARFFVEPFGYVEVLRAAAGGRKKRSTDYLRGLMNQGFTAVQGIGGHIIFSDGDHEMVYRALVYAPAVARKPGDKNTDKYDLAARMLSFPETEDLFAQSWVPCNVTMYSSFNVQIKEGFGYLDTLVDEFTDKGFFEDLILSIKNDRDGPRIDIKNDFVGNMKERVTLITDYRLPIGPKSERLLVAIDVTDPAAMAKTIDKAMESDPNAKKREFEGQVIWEILNESDNDKLEVKIEGAGGVGAEEDEERATLPNSAVTVAHGQLIIASHVDFVVDMLKKSAGEGSLGQSADYQTVNSALSKLGAGNDSVRGFSRTDEAYRPTYELIKQGKMPEAETLMAKILNRFLGPDEEGVLRDQEIDGSKMPEFDAVRRYLGPSGMFTKSEDHGWFITGCLLTKDADAAPPKGPVAAEEEQEAGVKTAAEPREVK